LNVSTYPKGVAVGTSEILLLLVDSIIYAECRKKKKKRENTIPEQGNGIGISGVGYKQLAAFNHGIMEKRDLVACQPSINFISLVIAID
jgi:hypothetical protein